MDNSKKTTHVFIGLDIGSVNAKLAALLPKNNTPVLAGYECSLQCYDVYRTSGNSVVILSKSVRTHGNLHKTALNLVNDFRRFFPELSISNIAVTGCGGKQLANSLHASYVNDFRALAEGIGSFHPQVSTILEIGGDSSRYLQIVTEKDNNTTTIVDYSQNGDCAAGTGSFLDQQASRLQFKIEEIGAIVSSTERAANIAGRCSVFAKSDMIHAQQRGFNPEEVLKGLCQAVARNFKGTIIHGRTLKPKVAFIGGVALNQGVADALQKLLDLGEADFIIPEYPAHQAAIGCALVAQKQGVNSGERNPNVVLTNKESTVDNLDAAPVLSSENVMALRHLSKTETRQENTGIIDAYMGIDIGSVSTNVALLDEDFNVLKEIYTKTNARPIDVVSYCMQQIADEFENRLHIRAVGTTGSGRELIGELIGTDTINDEITAHTTGAKFIADKYNLLRPDTIFEIGGQDSKFISISDGVVVDFTMNEACAAGTGSFLEEQAEKLGLNIIDEFAEIAFQSERPLRLGERCTVFMEKDVASYLRHNVSKADIAAGLAYSVAHNYLNRVVRNRKIGEAIFFQGGTAYNDSVAAALSQVLQKQIIVPPYNGVIGAIGMALLAKEKVDKSGETTFRGLRFRKENIKVRYFTCNGCSNYCHIQEFDVDGEKSYWGDKCSERFRKRRKSDYQPKLPDLFEYRRKLLEQDSVAPDGTGIRIGLPKTMYFYEQLPFWRTYLQTMGISVVLSESTNKKIIDSGIEHTVAEPCFPVIVAHGHVADLVRRNIDYIFIPNIINAAQSPDSIENYYCPWGQTLPFVVRSSPGFEEYRTKILCPTIRFQDGQESVKRSLREVANSLGLSARKSDIAVEYAYAAQESFVSHYQNAFASLLDEHIKNNDPAILLLGRPYNVHDHGINLDIGRKLRNLYGIDIIPMDAINTDSISIRDINPNLFWNYGQKIIRAAKFAAKHKNISIIYITNFKCGPDSYIKHFMNTALGKPYLTLQFDGHNNDAGILTRCEAFLDSIGFLRRWRVKQRRFEKVLESSCT